MAHKIGVDPDCVELARKFLADAIVAEAPSDKQVAADTQSLSEAIQVAIEDWFFAHSDEGTRSSCDVCGATDRPIATVIAYGIETNACNKCRGDAC